MTQQNNSLLPNLRLPSRVNQQWHMSGMDNPRYCNSVTHWYRYPHEVEYRYNSRGFRDQEWPADFNNTIWCLGDSFTVGIGSPVEHTWWYQLGLCTQRRMINVSMDGASNQWISRKAQDILNSGLCDTMIIQWSYTHRRERTDLSSVINQRWQRFYADVKDSTWPNCPNWTNRHTLPGRIIQELEQDPAFADVERVPDEDLRIDIPDRDAVLDPSQNSTDFLQCLDRVEQCQGTARIIHTFIPSWTDDLQLTHSMQTWPAHRHWLPEIRRLDWARDYHHYDILTAQQVAASIKNKLLV